MGPGQTSTNARKAAQDKAIVGYIGGPLPERANIVVTRDPDWKYEGVIAVHTLHEGIENTLVMLQHELKYGITVTRRFAALPHIPVYVDELNQVWTNLIHNAVDAMAGKGKLRIRTFQQDISRGD